MKIKKEYVITDKDFIVENFIKSYGFTVLSNDSKTHIFVYTKVRLFPYFYKTSCMVINLDRDNKTCRICGMPKTALEIVSFIENHFGEEYEVSFGSDNPSIPTIRYY